MEIAIQKKDKEKWKQCLERNKRNSKVVKLRISVDVGRTTKATTKKIIIEVQVYRFQ